jgi:hypothetical protein
VATPRKEGEGSKKEHGEEPEEKCKDLEYQVDEIVAALLGTDTCKAANVRVLRGFLGPGCTKCHLRVYLNAELDEFVEVHHDDVMLTQYVPAVLSPLGGSLVWVKRSAKLTYTRSRQVSASSEFLEGDLRERFRRRGGDWLEDPETKPDGSRYCSDPEVKVTRYCSDPDTKFTRYC